MKKYLFILLLIASSSCAVKVQEIALPDSTQTFGKIRTLISTSFDVKKNSNDSVKKINSTSKAFYNRAGKLLYQLDYSYLENSVSIDSTYYVYNDKKLLIRNVNSSNYDTNLIAENYIYDNRNRQIERISIVNDKLDYRVVKTYDKKGNVLTRAFYDSTNTLKNKDSTIYYYKSGYYESLSALTMKKYNYKTYFNKKGQLYLFKNYGKDSKLRSYTENYFDVHGNRIGNKNFDSGGKILGEYKLIYVYDDKGNWLKKSEYHNGKLFKYSENSITYW